MLYQTFELQRRAGLPAVKTAQLTAKALGALPAPLRELGTVRRLRALNTVFAGARPTFTRPSFAIDEVVVDGTPVPVHEEVRYRRAFASLLHFAKDLPAGSAPQQRVLVVGPMSGHFTTLIAPTIRTLLQDHDVSVLDWHNAREVPLSEGRFGFDEYVEHVMEALRELGPGTHVAAVCQPAVPVLAAVALLAADGDPAEPDSVTLIAGPIDTRVNPGKINDAAGDKPIEWFEKRVITTVPRGYAGAGRRVYPGFVQLLAFMSLNRKRHWDAHVGLYRDLVAGNDERAAKTTAFYDEYGAVMDTPAEFYLETVQRVFQEHLLPKGELVVRGRRVDPSLITKAALLTVEGSNDDMCSPGQTEAAHALCTGIPPERHAHHLQDGVGHYGVFSGSRWLNDVYPVVRAFVAASAREAVSAG
ncbi:MAG: polyhydroxyalkanoate depolymerase, intracellular [Frankiales bacterium]|nr:polyhydroxyalkanoate depolymerase, intracellular [Frankiales bacterium]